MDKHTKRHNRANPHAYALTNGYRNTNGNTYIFAKSNTDGNPDALPYRDRDGDAFTSYINALAAVIDSDRDSDSYGNFGAGHRNASSDTD